MDCIILHLNPSSFNLIIPIINLPINKTNLNNIIVTKIEDELSIPFRTAIAFSETFKNDKILYDKTTIKWKSFLNLGKGYKKEGGQ